MTEAVHAGEVWYSLQGDAHYMVLKDGELGFYAIEVEHHPQSEEWKPTQDAVKVWLTADKLTRYGWRACAHCGRGIIDKSEPNMGGPPRENWVHDPGGFTACYPQRGGDSPRAEPTRS